MAAALAEIRRFPVGIFQGAGEIHHAVLVRAVVEPGQVPELVHGLGEGAAEDEVRGRRGLRTLRAQPGEGEQTAAPAYGGESGGRLDAGRGDVAIEHGEAPAAIGRRVGHEIPDDGVSVITRSVGAKPVGANRLQWIDSDRRREAGFEGSHESQQQQRRYLAQRQEVDGRQAQVWSRSSEADMTMERAISTMGWLRFWLSFWSTR